MVYLLLYSSYYRQRLSYRIPASRPINCIKWLDFPPHHVVPISSQLHWVGDGILWTITDSIASHGKYSAYASTTSERSMGFFHLEWVMRSSFCECILLWRCSLLSPHISDSFQTWAKHRRRRNTVWNRVKIWPQDQCRNHFKWLPLAVYWLQSHIMHLLHLPCTFRLSVVWRPWLLYVQTSLLWEGFRV